MHFSHCVIVDIGCVVRLYLKIAALLCSVISTQVSHPAGILNSVISPIKFGVFKAWKHRTKVLDTTSLYVVQDLKRSSQQMGCCFFSVCVCAQFLP